MTGRGVHVVDAMVFLGGHLETVVAQSSRRALDYGVDDTTSMLFKFKSGATGYLGTVIATAETWRMQVFGSNGWAEVGDVAHLTTWDLRFSLIDRDNIMVKKAPHVMQFPQTSTERAELEDFARAVKAGKPLAVPGGDAVHNVAVLEAIMRSTVDGSRQGIGE
jgi:myo-inositol 2-dehydrogenase/D-chiro-inositol 1-dehydrogenase